MLYRLPSNLIGSILLYLNESDLLNLIQDTILLNMINTKSIGLHVVSNSEYFYPKLPESFSFAYPNFDMMLVNKLTEWPFKYVCLSTEADYDILLESTNENINYLALNDVHDTHFGDMPVKITCNVTILILFWGIDLILNRTSKSLFRKRYIVRRVNSILKFVNVEHIIMFEDDSYIAYELAKRLSLNPLLLVNLRRFNILPINPGSGHPCYYSSKYITMFDLLRENRPFMDEVTYPVYDN
jgi:hypothetical protein